MLLIIFSIIYDFLFQESDEETKDDNKIYLGSNFIEWPKSLASNNLGSLSDGDRPDSGVGESVSLRKSRTKTRIH